ncbi:MAG TPA: hypothetical protein VHP83_03060 [Aggregatilineaceae bacterium]|nr:hypothetical protein [Aggregatilineaceae bacterium]
MVPPPDNTGSEFPDFDKMTPEEAMAWLESLARRQGANADEFLTDANLDIPELPPDTVVDEPGYVPFSMTDKVDERPRQERKPEPPAPPKEEKEPEINIADQAQAVPDMSMEEAALDPMQWLDSLAAHPGEELEDLGLFGEGEADQFEAIFLDDEATSQAAALKFDFELDTEAPLNLEPPALPEMDDTFALDWNLEEPTPSEQQPAAVGEEDPLGGMDPMLWLESLAIRQGASADQLTTAANLEIEEVPEGTVVDEPGYVPFDISDGARAKKSPTPVPSEPEPQPIEAAAPSEEPAASPDELTALIGDDPMKWLESLAKRQGAKSEELTTTADLEIPELPPDTVVDEPGYTEYSPFSSFGDDEVRAKPRRVEVEPEPAPEPMAEELEPVAELFEAGDDALAWLADLAGEPEGDLSALLAEEEAPASDSISAEQLAEMTDEDIAYAQAHGQLTPQQELEWLQRQAHKLAEVRESQEMDISFLEEAEEEVRPAEPAELPSWLVEMQQVPEVSFEEEGTLEPEMLDIADWLGEAAPEAAVETSMPENLPELSGLPELTLEADVDSLWEEAAPQEIVPQEELIPESELAAFLEGDFGASAEDSLADALDDEFERKLVGDESEPEWYTEAVARGPVEAPPPIEVPPAPVVETLAEAAPIDMPDWLKDTTEEVPSDMAEGMPDWLAEPVAAEPVAPFEGMPDWLATVEEQAVGTTGLDWLPKEEVRPTPEPEQQPKPVLRAPEPTPEPVVSGRGLVIPPGPLFDKYRERLEANQNDYATRLALARALHANREVGTDLDHYEVLIEASQLLQDVSTDLKNLMQEQENNPRVRRLLGDTYMRQGMLQDALDAYRSALEQL